MDTTDLPHHYEITFAAITSTVLSLILPFWITKLIVSGLTDLLFESEQATFIQDKYLPELGNALTKVSVSFLDRLDILRKFTGMLMKIVYAFVWQEYFIPLTFIYNSWGLYIGAGFTPTWNKIASFVSGFP